MVLVYAYTGSEKKGEADWGHSIGSGPQNQMKMIAENCLG